jgi:hypothetical protein
MARFQFIGGSYQSQSPFADQENTINWYPEVMESPGAKTAMALYPTPGISLFSSPASGSGHFTVASIAVQGRAFVIVDNGNSTGALYEISSNGTATSRGSIVTNGTNSVFLVAGNFYLFFTSANHAYAFKLANNTLTEVTSSLATSNPSNCFFIDGYYGVLFANTNEFQISSLEDPTTWSGVDTAQVSVFPDNLVGCLVDHRVLWLWGDQHAQAYFDSGDPTFPLSVIPGAMIEMGLASPTSPVRMDNSVFWLGRDERGVGMAWRANGYTPVRISNHAMEYQWSQYSAGVTDAVSWTYQDMGHTFWMIWFPSGDVTWCYDAATNLWHQRGYWNGTSFDAHYGRNHMFAFGSHLVGSRVDGVVYQLSGSNLTDLGNTITRVRTAPAIATEMEWMFHTKLTIDMDMNQISNQTASLTLSWSDDGGNTWTAPQALNPGTTTGTVRRVVMRRLGRSRQRVYQLQAQGPIPWRILDAYAMAEPGFQAVPRLSKYFGQMQ